jgi:L-ascorbate metabolism protein UlaG (beta-lactamase superfamily)
VRVTYLGHATVLLELDGVRLLTDPLLRDRLGPLRRHGPVPDPATLRRLDAILISHAHPDHFDRRSLRMLEAPGRVIVPDGLGTATRRVLKPSNGVEVTELASWATTTVGSLRVTAVPARHWRWPLAPRVRTVGYVIEGSTRVYFAGDTGFFHAMDRLNGLVDVALLPIGRWGPHPGPDRLEPVSAARAANVVGAKIVIPIHWGTFYPPGFERLWPRALREPPSRFVAAAARAAPGVEVRVLQPGEDAEYAAA